MQGRLLCYIGLHKILIAIMIIVNGLNLGVSVVCTLYIWVIDQVWGQDGWILAKFFFCMSMDQDGGEVHKHAKKE